MGCSSLLQVDSENYSIGYLLTLQHPTHSKIKGVQGFRIKQYDSAVEFCESGVGLVSEEKPSGYTEKWLELDRYEDICFVIPSGENPRTG